MSSVRAAFAAGLVGGAVAAATIVGSLWSVGALAVPRAPSASAPAEVAAPAPVAGADEPIAPFAALERRLATLEANTERLLQREAADAQRVLVAAPPSDAPVEQVPAAALTEAVGDALALLERRRLEQMSDERLHDHARIAMKQADADTAVAALTMLHARLTDPTQRDAVALELAIARRQQGTPESLQASAMLLDGLVATHGLGSKLGVGAAQQLVHTHDERGDLAAAMRSADAIVRAPGITSQQRFQARWSLAIARARHGDRANAHAEFTALQQELAGQPDFAKLLADVERRLRDW